MNKLFALILVGTLAGLSAACASGSNTTAPTTTTNTTNSTVSTTSTPATNAAHSGNDDIPASVRAALPDAQSFSMQHKDIPAGTISEMERATGTPVTDRDHHSYLAFSTQGGARRQVGAATVVNAGGGELVIVYDSRNGMPVIREVRASNSSNLPAALLDQFRGKDHDAPITFGNDIRAAGGVEEATARQVTSAIKADVLAMQALYGAAHTH